MTDARTFEPRTTMGDPREQRGMLPIAAGKSEIRSAPVSLATPLWNLTPQQWRVFLLVGKALSNKAIAHELKVAESTVKAHVSAIFKMAGCRNRTEAALLSQRVRLGVLDSEETAPLPFAPAGSKAIAARRGQK